MTSDLLSFYVTTEFLIMWLNVLLVKCMFNIEYLVLNCVAKLVHNLYIIFCQYTT